MTQQSDKSCILTFSSNIFLWFALQEGLGVYISVVADPKSHNLIVPANIVFVVCIKTWDWLCNLVYNLKIFFNMENFNLIYYSMCYKESHLIL